MALNASPEHNQPNDDTPRPFSLRLSAKQRRDLEVRAGGMPLGEYIRSQLFASDAPRPPSRGPRPVKDHKALAEVLARLGGFPSFQQYEPARQSRELRRFAGHAGN